MGAHFFNHLKSDSQCSIVRISMDGCGRFFDNIFASQPHPHRAAGKHARERIGGWMHFGLKGRPHRLSRRDMRIQRSCRPPAPVTPGPLGRPGSPD